MNFFLYQFNHASDFPGERCLKFLYDFICYQTLFEWFQKILIIFFMLQFFLISWKTPVSYQETSWILISAKFKTGENLAKNCTQLKLLKQSKHLIKTFFVGLSNERCQWFFVNETTANLMHHSLKSDTKNVSEKNCLQSWKPIWLLETVIVPFEKYWLNCEFKKIQGTLIIF